MDQLSRASRALVRRPAGSNSYPRLLGLGSVGPRGRPAVLGVSGSGPYVRSPGVDQLSRVTCASVQGTACSTSCPGHLGAWSEFPWVRPALLGHSGSCPMACGVNQLSRATGARVRVPVGWTRFPGRLGPLSECPQGRPGVPGDMGPWPSALGVDHLSWSIRARARVRGPPRGRPAVQCARS